jgi:pyrroline-5-carboxylate reductase
VKFQRLALIGCGLMGGSFALALRQAGLVQHITGFSASEKTRQRALELEVIDQACSSVAEAVQGCRFGLAGRARGRHAQQLCRHARCAGTPAPC